MGAADSKTEAAGGEPNAVHDKTKKPMSATMWSKTRPVTNALTNIQRVGEIWKRFISNIEREATN